MATATLPAVKFTLYLFNYILYDIQNSLEK